MTTIVSPSLLACDFLNIESELKIFDEVNDLWFHLDIMDGHFVPNTTFGHPIVKKISNKTKIPLDAHLMVTNPEFYIDTFKDLGIHNLTWHIEATNDETLKLIKKAKEYFPSVGLSIKPKTPLDAIGLDLLKEIDLLLVMSVEPGFGGQSFIEESYDRIKHFSDIRKKESLNFKIQVDGGVSDKNSDQLIKTGADNLVAGSYIFKADPTDYEAKVDSLRGQQ
jgi:ribulose-phosphate 3-epimerase